MEWVQSNFRTTRVFYKEGLLSGNHSERGLWSEPLQRRKDVPPDPGPTEGRKVLSCAGRWRGHIRDSSILKVFHWNVCFLAVSKEHVLKPDTCPSYKNCVSTSVPSTLSPFLNLQIIRIFLTAIKETIEISEIKKSVQIRKSSIISQIKDVNSC